MTTREHLKIRYRLMVVGVIIIPVLSVLWLRSSTPPNHTFRVDVIALAEIALLSLFFFTFKCSNCRANLSKISRQVPNNKESGYGLAEGEV
jgi:hypothetical protein